MRNKKNLAAKILKTSHQKVRFAEGALADVQKAITRSDIRGLIAVGKITIAKGNLHSRFNARKIAAQKRKGRQSGRGSKKGKKYSILSSKDQWMNKIRVQREFLKLLKEKSLVSPSSYRSLYLMSKGGYFRNKRHIKLYLTEHRLIEKKN